MLSKIEAHISPEELRLFQRTLVIEKNTNKTHPWEGSKESERMYRLWRDVVDSYFSSVEIGIFLVIMYFQNFDGFSFKQKRCKLTSFGAH